MFQIPNNVLYIIDKLHENKFKAFIVGGSVRDLIIGKKIYDWDISTDASPAQVTSIFEKVIPTGIDFGTVTVIHNNENFEITTFRCEERYTDGRHPDKISFAKNIKDDLSRRDFTVNAIAYDPVTDEIVDPFNGQDDIKAKLIRSVGDPIARFNEDGLRPMRACRFAASLNFKIEKNTLDAIKKTLDIFRKVSPERIHDEIIKMLCADKPSIGIEYLRESRLLNIIMPELEEGIGVEQPKQFHVWDVYYHNIYSCDFGPKEKPVLRLALLFHDISKPECKVDETFYNHENIGALKASLIMKRLKFSNFEIDYVANLISNHMFNYSCEWSDSAVRRFIKRVGIDNIEDLFAFRKADMLAMDKDAESSYLNELGDRIKKIIDDENALDVSDLKINGLDLMKEFNIKEGPLVGKILNYLLEKVLDEPGLNEKEKLMGLVRDFINV